MGNQGATRAVQSEQIVKTISFERKELDAIADKILVSGGPRALRYRESRAGGRTVVFVAHHQDATRVLTDEIVFSLEHYAKLVGAVAPPGIRLIMAPPTPSLKHQREVFYGAAKRMRRRAVSDAIQGHGATDPKRSDVARAVVRDVLDSLRAREESEFDIMAEYGHFVPYLVGREVFGVGGPVRSGLLVSAAAVARWVIDVFWRGWSDGLQAMIRQAYRSVHRFSPETTPFLATVYLAQFTFLQTFGNFENRNPLIRWIAKRGGAAFTRHIGARLDKVVGGYDPFPESLLSLLSEDVKARKATREEAIALVVEMFGTIAVVAPSAFTGIVAWMVKQKGGIPAVLETLTPSNARGFVDELLRLNPPSRHLLRTAVEHTTFGDVEVHAGDYVCALVAQACRDSDVFTDPGRFDPTRQVTGVLHFGPMDGPHQCLGRELARDMLGEMLLGLKGLPELEPLGDVGAILGFPQLLVRWKRERPLVRDVRQRRTGLEPEHV